MNLDEFIKKYDNKEVDWDASYGNQCKDLFSAYNAEVVGCPYYIYGNAKDLMNADTDEFYDKIYDNPQKGDVIIWGTGIGEWGHVAIFIEGDSSFTSFDQNFPIGSPCHFQGHTNKNIIGYLRPKINQEDTMWNDNEVRSMFEAVRHDFLGQNPSENDLNADMGAAKERQKEPNDWALSEFVHDRKKEVPPKDCTTEIKKATKNLQDEMSKEMSEHNAFVLQAEKETKKRDEAIAKLNGAVKKLAGFLNDCQANGLKLQDEAKTMQDKAKEQGNYITDLNEAIEKCENKDKRTFWDRLKDLFR